MHENACNDIIRIVAAFVHASPLVVVRLLTVDHSPEPQKPELPKA